MSDVIDRLKGRELGSIEAISLPKVGCANISDPYFHSYSFNDLRKFIENYCRHYDIDPKDVYSKYKRTKAFTKFKCDLTYSLLERGVSPTDAAKALKCDRSTIYYRAWTYANEHGLPHVVNVHGVKKRPDVDRLPYAWFCELKFPILIIKHANGAFEWNWYMDEILRRLDAEKLSQSKIASIMSDVIGVSVNTNQVAGRRSRLGLRRCD